MRWDEQEASDSKNIIPILQSGLVFDEIMRQ